MTDTGIDVTEGNIGEWRGKSAAFCDGRALNNIPLCPPPIAVTDRNLGHKQRGQCEKPAWLSGGGNLDWYEPFISDSMLPGCLFSLYTNFWPETFCLIFCWQVYFHSRLFFTQEVMDLFRLDVLRLSHPFSGCLRWNSLRTCLRLVLTARHLLVFTCCSRWVIFFWRSSVASECIFSRRSLLEAAIQSFPSAQFNWTCKLNSYGIPQKI